MGSLCVGCSLISFGIAVQMVLCKTGPCPVKLSNTRVDMAVAAAAGTDGAAAAAAAAAADRQG